MNSQEKWLRIGLFYLIAIGISAAARLWWHSSDPTPVTGGAGAMYFHLLAGAGPTLGALAVWLAVRHRSTMTLGGSNLRLAAVMIAMPALVMGVKGVPNPFGMESHLFGVHMGVWIALYALLEEIGWRGYLQDEFSDRRPLVRYAIVGLFWYAWHLSWLKSTSPVGEAVTILFMVLASIGIGFVADRTRSILAAAAFHILGNIMGLTTDFRAFVPSHERWAIAGICLVLWIVLLRIWRTRVAAGSASGTALSDAAHGAGSVQ